MPAKQSVDGDPGKPGRTGEPEVVPPEPPARSPIVALPHLDFDLLADSVAASLPGDAEYRQKVHREAIRLSPLREMQANYSQTSYLSRGLTRGEPWPYQGGFSAHAKGALRYAEERRDVLAVAAAKAQAAVDQIRADTLAVERALAGKGPDDGGD